jgi:RNA recognition motif-containing protein
MKRLFIGNISFDATEQDVREFFNGYKILNVKLINDHDTGKFRGFAFVELEADTEAQRAVQELNEQSMLGRAIIVNEAHEKRGGGNGRLQQLKDRGHNDSDRRERGRRDDRDQNDSWKR